MSSLVSSLGGEDKFPHVIATFQPCDWSFSLACSVDNNADLGAQRERERGNPPSIYGVFEVPVGFGGLVEIKYGLYV